MIVDIVDKYLTDDNNPIKNLRLKSTVDKKWRFIMSELLQLWIILEIGVRGREQ
jgi:hypothetical protein